MRVKAETAEDALLMAYSNYKLNNFEEMLTHVKEALGMRADYPLAFHYKALALRGLGDLKGAEAAIKEAVKKDEHNYHNIFLLGIIQWNMGEMKEAEENLKKAITYSPKDPLFLVEYATLLVHRGRFEEALDSAYKAKSLDKHAPKVNKIIKSAKQKEFLKGIDALVYDPPFPYSEKLVFPYLKIAGYYLRNDYLANAQAQFAKALEIDNNNAEAKSGFATATRLREGGFYNFARGFAQFLVKWYTLVSIGLIVIFLTWVAVSPEKTLMWPALFIAAAFVAMILFFVLTGLKRMKPDEYNKILREWNVDSVDKLMEKMEEMSTEASKELLEQEATVNKARNYVSYSNMFAFIFWICLVAEVAMTRIDTTFLSVDTQDNISNLKKIMALGILLSVALSLWLRTRARMIVDAVTSQEEE